MTTVQTAVNAVASLAEELVDLLGPRNVSTDGRMLERASVDGARMSPLISEQLPLGVAEIVAFPTSAEQIADVVRAAVAKGIPVTPRGKGTGNYGQAIPLSGGLVLDMSRARTIVEVGEETITADAGASMAQLEQAASEHGRELWMYPSTMNSSIGGFLSGGSGGTGTIEHGANHEGFVAALDVVHADGAGLVHVEGEEAQVYVHNYGTAGIIARATVRTEPLVTWRALYASFPDVDGSVSVLRDIGNLRPAPRLVSADTVTVSEALPDDPAIPEGRSSLRAILHPDTLETARTMIEQAGGRIEDIRRGSQAVAKMSMLSYNHPIEWLQKSRPGFYYHLEVGGDLLVDDLDLVHATIGDGLLHVEAGHTVPIGMLAAEYTGPECIDDAIRRLTAIGVRVHNCHQWNVDFEIARTVERAARTDPGGLLNPGKLNPAYSGAQKGSIR
ncbi:FAD-binding oxidoreductase [Microbacterium amylolyticum]|uniref:FAD/FMN-containing dehydrogenase n=1 Tax=Microbacterium amylolyticum TaxID=936337 RepID=A0ABS4ZJV4_9MICO|nr:FAD-binding oxidoreductase [Microbacterium amylolyticum]MBP2437288.1 FAD/FMN-containing dehydrogenase [Microbacterium amylolyticum]